MRVGGALGQRAGGPAAVNKIEGDMGIEAGRDADISDFQRAAEFGARECQVASFGVSQRHGDVGGDTGGVNLARVAAQAGGKVHREQAESRIARPRCAQGGQDVLERALYGSCASGSEYGIKDEMRGFQGRVQARVAWVVGGGDDTDAHGSGSVQLGIGSRALTADVGGDARAPALEMPGGHKSVGSVVAWANQGENGDAVERADDTSGSSSDGEAGVLHERVGGDASGL